MKAQWIASREVAVGSAHALAAVNGHPVSVRIAAGGGYYVSEWVHGAPDTIVVVDPDGNEFED